MEGDKFSVKKAFSVASLEYIKWITNPKILIFFVMYIFVYDYVVKELVGASNKMSCDIMVLEPVIAIINSPLLLLVVPSVFLGLMSDFPKVDGNSMFYIYRVGKINWLFGQVIFCILTSLTFIATMSIMSALCVVSNCTIENKWSDVITKYTNVFPNESQSVVANLITGKLYNNINPIEAFGLSCLSMLLYMIIISLILLIGFLSNKKTISIAVVGSIICVGSVLIEMNSKAMWIFPTSHTLQWLHFDEIYKKQFVNVGYSYIYFIFISAILLFAISELIHTYDFSKITEMDE